MSPHSVGFDGVGRTAEKPRRENMEVAAFEYICRIEKHESCLWTLSDLKAELLSSEKLNLAQLSQAQPSLAQISSAQSTQ